jgi:phenylacetic acid degradation operon negative regulatory protein
MRAPLAAARPDPQVARWIVRELAQARPRAPSLIITIWGDAIAPHGGAVMLPGFFRLLAAFGINERQGRTSVFRLSREGWLAGRRIGRRSLYRLTVDGARRFEQAYRRIYAPPVERWDDTWELVAATGLPTRRKQALRDVLAWEGYGVFAPGVYARPAQSAGTLPATATAAAGADARLLAVRAHDDPSLGGASLASTIPRAWDLTAIATDYRRFLRRFGGVIERFRTAPEEAHDPEQCFLVRTLLIHAYRRVLLRDPRLPGELLPLDWPGTAAFALCRDFYRLTQRSAEQYLSAVLEGPRGSLPPATAWFYDRFGGLETSSTALR